MALTLRNRTRFLHLVLFFAVVGCVQKTNLNNVEVEILWEDDKAVGISILEAPGNRTFFEGDVESNFKVRIADSQDVHFILGNFESDTRQIVFKPLIAFSPEKTYEVLYLDHIIDTFKVPGPDPAEGPKITGIFPSSDTVPENLLKIYLQFSNPMAEGQSYGNIIVMNQNNDTLKGIFLDLQPELWNEDQTILTLWLDPGRIKRDLIPNQIMGTPLEYGKRYQLIVSSQWKGANGLSLINDYLKEIYVLEADRQKPVPDRWKLIIPVAVSRDPLQIQFGEAMDFVLISSAIYIAGPDEKEIDGEIKTLDSESKYSFTPTELWVSGDYAVIAETRLEDQAGNNIVRLFDSDLTTDPATTIEGSNIRISFTIQ